MELIEPEFVEFIPKTLSGGRIYISKKYQTAIHLCCCGCGEQVVTPLKENTGWRLTERNGKVSLSPSIGNWSLNCQSHYFIKENRILWAEQWPAEMIASGRKADAFNKKHHYSKQQKNSFLSAIRDIALNIFQAIKDFFSR